MFQPALNLIREECSGLAALSLVRDISGYHRIQASPGYRQAAQYILAKLQAWGLQAEVLTFKADFESQYGGECLWPEWEAQSGTLHLIEPADSACKLADFRETPISLIQRSSSTAGEYELVALPDKGEELKDYEGLAVAGKIVIASGNVMRVYALAVEKFGAKGIIFDGMRKIEPIRPAMALPDTIQYTSFWWSKEDRPCFGFALSPRRGQWLRELAAKQTGDAKPLRVRAQVDSRLHAGHFEDVTALVPGDGAEEILVVSHLCHPAPSANDNASGAAAALEAARALQHLISENKLPRPKRSIRFLWVPEMTGTYAYLAIHSDRIGKTIAGLNLDMVGEDQTQTGSVMLIEKPSEALPSFAPVLLERLREEFFSEAKSHSGQGGFPLFRHAVTSFSGGSDHFILSDPLVGIPTPMIIQWPDKFYHTSADTPDKVSPEALGRATALAAAYSYWLACAGEKEADWLGHEMNCRFKQRVLREIQNALTEIDPSGLSGMKRPGRKLAFQLARHQAALDSLTRLGRPEIDAFKKEAELFLKKEQSSHAELSGHADPEEPDLAPETGRRVPRRMHSLPISPRAYVRKLAPQERDAYWTFDKDESGHTLQTIALYWADGKRTLVEIIDCVEWETGVRKAAMLVEYFQWMEKAGIIKFE
jgi:hypothetical protein